MTNLARLAGFWHPVNAPRVFLLSVLVPVLIGTSFWFSVARSGESEQKTRWIILRRRIQVFFLVEIAALAAFSDLYRPAHPSLLWCAFVAGVALVQLICYCLDRTFLQSRWTPSDVVRLTFWRTLSPAVALVLVATAFDAIYAHHLIAVLWLVAAAIVARAGDIGLRFAEGMKLQKVKSGAAYKRAFALAKEMKTRMERVYMVPAGRGHMTNAFGLGHSIALTDNYGKFLHGPQLDFVIGHELGHVREQHGRKQLLIAVAIYGTLGAMALVVARGPIAFRALFDVIALLGPVLLLRWISRRCEYEADRRAVELTRDPMTGIKALASLYRITQSPTNFSWATELFMTHPSLANRAQAIGKIGKLEMEQITNAVTSTKTDEVLAK